MENDEPYRRSSQDILKVVDGFLALLDETISGPEFDQLVFGKIQLKDVDIGFKPEAFTQYNLILPILYSVGLELQLEPRSKGISREQWPDFLLMNTTIKYLGESKPMNSIEEGVDEIREYLGIDGFPTPYGLLTDGVRWQMFGPPEEGGASAKPIDRQSIRLREAFKWVAVEQNYSNLSVSSTDKSEGISQIDTFSTFFAPERLDAWVINQMSVELRHRFVDPGISLQASLEDWQATNRR